MIHDYLSRTWANVDSTAAGDPHHLLHIGPIVSAPTFFSSSRNVSLLFTRRFFSRGRVHLKEEKRKKERERDAIYVVA